MYFGFLDTFLVLMAIIILIIGLIFGSAITESNCRVKYETSEFLSVAEINRTGCFSNNTKNLLLKAREKRELRKLIDTLLEKKSSLTFSSLPSKSGNGISSYSDELQNLKEKLESGEIELEEVIE